MKGGRVGEGGDMGQACVSCTAESCLVGME